MKKYIKSSKYSHRVVIPKEVIEKYGQRTKQRLVISDKGRGLLEIRDWKNRK